MSTINLPLTTGRIKHIEENWNEFAIGSTASLSRIYERLRKRSYRKMRQPAANPWSSEWTAEEEWIEADHHAYLLGVRDALNAVAGRQR